MKSKLLKPKTKTSFITYGLLLAVFLIVQLLISTHSMTSMMKGLLVPLCTYAILAVSLNLTVGILGDLSLGQAGFMCIGAYSGAVFSLCTENVITSVWLRFPIALILGGIFAAVMGVLIGIPVLRLKGDYLAIVTLAFGEIIKGVFATVYCGIDSNGLHFSLAEDGLNLAADGKMLISGALGISGTPNDSNYIIGFVLLLITLIISYNFINSRTGRAVMAIRDNRIAAESVGINITKYKLITFALTAFLAGVAGVLYSHSMSAIQTGKFDYNTSILILVFVVLGGMGNIRGSVIATVILYMLPEVLRPISQFRMLIYAVILIVMMILTSNPVTKSYIEKYSEKIKKWFEKVFKRKSVKEAE